MKSFDRKMIARLVLVFVAVGLAALLSDQGPTERVIRVHNAGKTEVRDVELRWLGAKAGWVRISPGDRVEVRARTSGEGFLELSFTSSQGLPFSERMERVIRGDSPQVMEIRLLKNGGVYWPVAPRRRD